MSQLRGAETVFTAIGVTKAASIVRRARQELTEIDPPIPLSRVVENLETALADSDEAVDQMIAEFANKLARARSNTAKD